MHLAFIATPDLSYVSGSSLSLRYTVEALGRLGIECTVLCQHAPTDAAAPGVRYIELPMPLDYQVITDSTPSAADLASCLNQLVAAVVDLPRVDLIHAIYGTFTGAAATLAGALLGVPVAISTFGRDLTLGAAVDQRYHELMKISYGQADLVVAADDMAAALVTERYAGPGTEVCVLPPGMNFRMLRQTAAARGRRDRGHRLLAVQSSFNEQKGLGVLFDAFAHVLAAVPDAELIVAGHDDTPGARIEAKLRDQAATLGIADRVRFLGHLEHQQVAEVMADCDVLVDPRLINSFSSCLYEAMTVGLVVVASDVPCNRDALGGGDHGVLTLAGESASLAAGILTILHDEQTAARLREAAAGKVLWAAEQYDCDVVAERLRRIYESMLTTHEADRAISRAALMDDKANVS